MNVAGVSNYFPLYQCVIVNFVSMSVPLACRVINLAGQVAGHLMGDFTRCLDGLSIHYRGYRHFDTEMLMVHTKRILLVHIFLSLGPNVTQIANTF